MTITQEELITMLNSDDDLIISVELSDAKGDISAGVKKGIGQTD